MKKKFFTFHLIVLVILCLCFAACSEAHIHHYAEAWSKDQEYHWHDPLCSDAQPQKDAHNFIDNECSICGFVKKADTDKNTDEGQEQAPESNSGGESKEPSEQIPTESEGRISEAVLSVVRISATFKLLNGSEGAGFGAGVIYQLDRPSCNAYILTNFHVIYNADTQSKFSTHIDVWLYGSENKKEALSAKLLGGAIDKDVAVLEIKGSDVVSEEDGGQHTNKDILEKSAARAITIGNSDELSVGDTVYAIGNPAGYGTSMTRGVLSVAAEYKQMPSLDTTQEQLYEFPFRGRMISILEMRVDAAINDGNSGGGLFNANGKYMGTVNAREVANGVVGFGYAIPSNLMVAIANKIIKNNDHTATHADFGFTVKSEVSKSVYENGAARVYQTVVVATVNEKKENSDTVSGIKLKSGDVFISYRINDEKEVPIVHNYQLSIASYILEVGDTFTMTVKRGDDTIAITYRSLEGNDFVEDKNK